MIINNNHLTKNSNSVIFNNSSIDDDGCKNNKVVSDISNQNSIDFNQQLNNELVNQLNIFNDKYKDKTDAQKNLVQSLGSYVDYVKSNNSDEFTHFLSKDLSVAVLMLMVMANYTSSSATWVKFISNIDTSIQQQADLVSSLVSFLQGISNALSTFKNVQNKGDVIPDYVGLSTHDTTDSSKHQYREKLNIDNLIPDKNSALYKFIHSRFGNDIKDDRLRADQVQDLVVDVTQGLVSKLGSQFDTFDIASHKGSATGESEQVNSLIQYLQENVLKDGENERITSDQMQNKDFNQSLQQMAQRIQNFFQAFARV
jgi:hypothetical protein